VAIREENPVSSAVLSLEALPHRCMTDAVSVGWLQKHTPAPDVETSL